MEGEYSLIANIIYILCALALPLITHVMWKNVKDEKVDKVIAYATSIIIALLAGFFGINELIKHL